MSLNHSPAIVTDGLVLCLDAANQRSYPKTGTTWSDLVGEYDGTLTNGPTFDAGNGGSIVFDGSNDYGSITTEDFKFTTSFSVATFVKINSFSPSWLRIVDYSHFASPRNGWLLGQYSNSNKIEFRLDQIGNGDGSVVTPVLSTGQWYYIVGVYNSNTNFAQLYQNTDVVDSQNTSGAETYTSVTKLGIAARLNPFPIEHANCNIATIQIYNRALTADEVRRNYEATVGRYT
jgi:hypothetical protein